MEQINTTMSPKNGSQTIAVNIDKIIESEIKILVSPKNVIATNMPI